jgi:hypothetical protein
MSYATGHNSFTSQYLVNTHTHTHTYIYIYIYIYISVKMHEEEQIFNNITIF